MPNENSSEDWQEGTERSEYDGLFVWRVLDAMARRRTLAAACEVLGAASVKRLRLFVREGRQVGVRRQSYDIFPTEKSYLVHLVVPCHFHTMRV